MVIHYMGSVLENWIRARIHDGRFTPAEAVDLDERLDGQKSHGFQVTDREAELLLIGNTFPELLGSKFEKEFPHALYDKAVIKALLDQGFTDESWHNNSCPSFMRDGITVWVETVNSQQREVTSQSQFCVTTSEMVEDAKYTLLECETAELLIYWLVNELPKRNGPLNRICAQVEGSDRVLTFDGLTHAQAAKQTYLELGYHLNGAEKTVTTWWAIDRKNAATGKRRGKFPHKVSGELSLSVRSLRSDPDAVSNV